MFSQMGEAVKSACGVILDIVSHAKTLSLIFALSAMMPILISWPSFLRFFVYADLSAMRAGAGTASALALLFCVSMVNRDRLQRWFTDVYISSHPVRDQRIHTGQHVVVNQYADVARCLASDNPQGWRRRNSHTRPSRPHKPCWASSHTLEATPQSIRYPDVCPLGEPYASAHRVDSHPTEISIESGIGFAAQPEAVRSSSGSYTQASGDTGDLGVCRTSISPTRMERIGTT